MAAFNSRGRHRRVFIYDLPHSILDNVSIILDTNDKWKELVTPFGFTTTDLSRFERCIRQGTSPSYTMIIEWGQQNHKINDLFCALSRIRQYRAMTLLKDYVSSQYHHLLPIEGSNTLESKILKPADDSWMTSDGLPKPPLPTCSVKKPRMPMQETAYGSAFGNSTCVSKNGSWNLEYQFSDKLNVDSCNFNQPDSGSSMPSKVPLANSKQSYQSSWSQPSSVGSRANVALPRPPIPDIKLQQPSSFQPAIESLEDNTRIPSSYQFPPQDRAHHIWQHPHNHMRRPSDISSSKSRDNVNSSYIGDSMLPLIHYEDIINATDNFSTEKIIGRGGFGIVYEGIWKNTKVAIKRIIKQSNPGSTSLEEAKLQQSYVELRTLNKYRHDNILPLYGYSEQDNGLCLIYQFMVNGSLEDRLLQKNGTPALVWRKRLQIARGAACGIQFLHTCDKQIIHGDIKSANILLDDHLEPKIGDFGLAREGPMSQCTYTLVSAVHGTQPYLPADYIKDKQLSPKVDTYSFGIVLFELATGLRAYDGDRPKHKYLREYVMEWDKMKYDVLRDQSAGQEWSEVFLDFIMKGSECADSRKKIRPEMVKVLEFLDNKLRFFETKESSGLMPCQSDEPKVKADDDVVENVSKTNVSTDIRCNAESVQTPFNSSPSESMASESDNGSVSPAVSTVPWPNVPNLTVLGTKNPS